MPQDNQPERKDPSLHPVMGEAAFQTGDNEETAEGTGQVPEEEQETALLSFPVVAHRCLGWRAGSLH